MKKFLVFLGLMLLLATPLFAQRAAVMEFKAGVGISQADVDGLSGIFTTYFRPAGFTMVERTQIDRVISEHGFQRSSLTEAQMVRIGEILNLSMIVIGDINVVAGEYNVDARVVNVESGVIIATDGESFRGSYRESMKKLAQRLAGQVAVRPGQTVQAAPKPAPKPEPKKPQWSEKSSKTMKWDEAIYYCDNLSEGGHSDWRLPNIEELKTFLSKQNSDSGYFFWSSTPHLMVNHTAWRVGFDIVDKTLHYSNYPKSDKYYVRCVRKAE